MIKLISERNILLTAIGVAVGASIAVGYDILQDVIKLILPNTYPIVLKLEAGGLSISLGIIATVVWLKRIK